jgi:lysophospholipid acyltransferase (LPLAT)-like uncharacterized protein
MQGRSGEVLSRVLCFLASVLIRFLRLTWRVTIAGSYPPPLYKPVVFCFWHGEQAGLFAYPHKRRVVILSSLSKDGALQSCILKRLNFVVVRGSSSRSGASGLKGVVKAINDNHDCAFAVDGPKGPFHKAKPGAVKAAELTGALIIPMRVAAAKSWVFKKSWDRYTLPRPFTRVTVTVGAPIMPGSATVNILTDALNSLSSD